MSILKQAAVYNGGKLIWLPIYYDLLRVLSKRAAGLTFKDPRLHLRRVRGPLLSTINQKWPLFSKWIAVFTIICGCFAVVFDTKGAENRQDFESFSWRRPATLFKTSATKRPFWTTDLGLQSSIFFSSLTHYRPAMPFRNRNISSRGSFQIVTV